MPRTVLTLIVGVALALSVVGHVVAEPGYDQTLAGGPIYRFEPTPPDWVMLDDGNYQYTWNVVFNGSEELFGPLDEQFMSEFIVYDYAVPPSAVVDWNDTIITDEKKFVGWVGSDSSPNTVVKWTASPASMARIAPGETVSFTATLTELLADPVNWTAIKVQWGENSSWVNPTPELPAHALALLGIPFAWILRRRRTA